MFWKSCHSWKPDSRAGLLLALILLAGFSLNGMQAVGETTAGMKFRGEVTGLREDSVQLLLSGRGEATPVGIPVGSIRTLQLIFPDSPRNGPETLPETLLPLLPLCDNATLIAVLERARALGESGDWPGAYLWATRLGAVMTSPQFSLEAGLLEAQALLEMGLTRRLGPKLEALNAAADPLSAPLLLCWLNASLHRRTGATEQARFWAELPALRIPASKGALADQLAALATELTNSTRIPSP